MARSSALVATFISLAAMTIAAGAPSASAADKLAVCEGGGTCEQLGLKQGRDLGVLRKSKPDSSQFSCCCEWPDGSNDCDRMSASDKEFVEKGTCPTGMDWTSKMSIVASGSTKAQFCTRAEGTPSPTIKPDSSIKPSIKPDASIEPDSSIKPDENL